MSSDSEQITGTIVSLFVGTDERDWPAVQKLFTPSVSFDMGTPSTMTPAQITDGWDKGLKAIEKIHHQAGNFRIRVRGDEADAFCYGIAYHYRRTKTGRNTRVFVGSYDFTLRRSGDHWKISAFKFNLKFIDGNPDLEND
jgi:SnoaL-like protein